MDLGRGDDGNSHPYPVASQCETVVTFRPRPGGTTETRTPTLWPPNANLWSNLGPGAGERRNLAPLPRDLKTRNCRQIQTPERGDDGNSHPYLVDPGRGDDGNLRLYSVAAPLPRGLKTRNCRQIQAPGRGDDDHSHPYLVDLCRGDDGNSHLYSVA